MPPVEGQPVEGRPVEVPQEQPVFEALEALPALEGQQLAAPYQVPAARIRQVLAAAPSSVDIAAC